MPSKKVKKCCRWSQDGDEVGTPEEIAKAVHQTLDWLRACDARPNDNRGVDALSLLTRIQKGFELTDNFPTHYEGD